MRKIVREFRVCLFVALGCVALLFLVLKVGNMTSLPFQATYSIMLKFDNIGSLKSRAPVKCAGVVVGTVASIGFDRNTYQAMVTTDIQKQYQFPKDSSAKILTSGLLGEQYVSIEPGGARDMLKTGDTITMTQSALVLENVIAQLLYSKAANLGAAAPAAPARAPVPVDPTSPLSTSAAGQEGGPGRSP